MQELTLEAIVDNYDDSEKFTWEFDSTSFTNKAIADKAMTKANYCKDLEKNSLDCKNRLTFTLNPQVLYSLGEDQEIVFKCKYLELSASISIRFARFPQMPLPVIEFSGKAGSSMQLKLDFGEEYYDQIRIFIFRIPKRGYKDPNTGTMIKPGSEASAAITQANSKDRDVRKIYKRDSSQSKELRAADQANKIKIVKLNSKKGLYKEKIFIKNKRKWKNDEYTVLIKIRASRA